ncbi:uncharacterized protein LOC111699291 [Eurytemora carolleeae]|uniref:uncharacterized protein LOC111699291 n=1 Tax=Eurytemora carolleeae TaxID=1294199 RepID=UPI000C7952A7|nr:uncharacterized protein LOC111699291 [Eurytemora carolleeae]XP_023325694.1 uncharacterized protein LOC111699291 [Eurytemora carolleeae]|eukprot:XP_023325693.1 uncharacterized protein LOC111699291 [Eurytemora affinis]
MPGRILGSHAIIEGLGQGQGVYQRLNVDGLSKEEELSVQAQFQGRLCIEKSKLGYGRTWILNTSSQFSGGTGAPPTQLNILNLLENLGLYLITDTVQGVNGVRVSVFRRRPDCSHCCRDR